jgi:hypothetical protein
MSVLILPTQSASQLFAEIAIRQISLVPVFGDKLWSASVDIKGGARHNRKRSIASVSATAPTPAGAVKALIEKLDGVATQEDRW